MAIPCALNSDVFKKKKKRIEYEMYAPRVHLRKSILRPRYYYYYY